MKTLAIILGLVVVTTLSLVVAGSRGPAGTPRTEAVAPAVARRSESPRPTALPRPAPVAPTALAQAAPAPEPVEPATYAAQMERRLAGQQIDRAWSSAAQAGLEHRLATMLPGGAELRALECRGDLCRLELRHLQIDDYRDFVHRAFLDSADPVWDGPTFSTILDQQPDGRVVTVSYLARAD
jgi:hypothetical protein